jgi:hypothetical protein
MSPTVKRFFIPASVVVALLLGASRAAYEYWMMREPLHAKITETRMRELMYLLESERPVRVDSESIRRVLAANHHDGWGRDAWGTDFVIERDVHLDGRYVITSLAQLPRFAP